MVIQMNEFAPELELPTVHIDNLTAAFNAMNYLLDLGHKRIGCTGRSDAACHYRLQRCCVQALRRSGIVVDPHYIARGDFYLEAKQRIKSSCLSNRCRLPPSLSYDVMQLAPLLPGQAPGLKVPDDLSIIGFRTIALAEFYRPSVDKPWRAAAHWSRGDAAVARSDAGANEQRLAFNGLRADYSRFYARLYPKVNSFKTHLFGQRPAASVT